MKTNSTSMRTIIADNLNSYIESSGRSASWIMTKTGIPKSTYYKLLKGEGDLDKHLEAIIELFGINDPFYFHNANFVKPKSIEEIRKESDITNLAAANYHALNGEEKEFKQTMEILNDFIDMIEILKNNNSNTYLFED